MKKLLWVWLGWRIFSPGYRPGVSPGQEHPLRIPATTVYVGDREFAVRQLGEGPDVVLIHGLTGASLAEWYKVAPLLAVSARVTMVDNRNHGLSPRHTDRFEIDEMASDLAAVLGKVGVEKAVVVGYSMGGAIAQSLARHSPHLVKGLVLVAALAAHPLKDRRLRTVGVLVTRIWERLTGVGTPEVRAFYLLKSGAVEARHARWLWAECRRRDPEAGAQSALALLRFDSRSWLSQLTMPATVIVPTGDRLVPPTWQYELWSRLTGAELIEVIDGGHELPWTHPEVVATATIDRL